MSHNAALLPLLTRLAHAAPAALQVERQVESDYYERLGQRCNQERLTKQVRGGEVFHPLGSITIHATLGTSGRDSFQPSTTSRQQEPLCLP